MRETWQLTREDVKRDINPVIPSRFTFSRFKPDVVRRHHPAQPYLGQT